MADFSFATSIEQDDRTGEIIAVYFQIRKGRAHTTKEYAEGLAFADYDREGKLLGIELLGPCKVAVLDQIAKAGRVRNFVKESIPRGMLVGA